MIKSFIVYHRMSTDSLLTNGASPALGDGGYTDSSILLSRNRNTSTLLMENMTTEEPWLPTTISVAGTDWEPIISETVVRTFSYIIKSYATPPVCMLGFIGNLFGVGVLWRQAKQQKLSIFWYLCVLTIMGIIFLGLGIVESIPVFVRIYDANLSKYLVAYMQRSLSYCNMISLHTARLTVVVMSCERLLSVARPLHVKTSWFAKYPVRLVMGCLLFNALFALPFVINGTVITQQKQNETVYMYTFKNYKTLMSKYWVVQVVVQSFIPMLILIPINIAIPVQFYRARKRLRTALESRKTGSSGIQRKITGTVLIITVLYILLSVPLIIIKLLQLINPNYSMVGKYRLVFWFFVDLGKFLAFVNAANDFLVFFLVSNNYRAVFKKMYCGCYTQDVDGEKSLVQASTPSASHINGSSATLSSSLADKI